VEHCDRENITFTRSRPLKKDDNAHIEQKNWTHVRKLIGWDRYDSPQALKAMNDLFRHELRLYMKMWYTQDLLYARRFDEAIFLRSAITAFWLSLPGASLFEVTGSSMHPERVSFPLSPFNSFTLPPILLPTPLLSVPF